MMNLLRKRIIIIGIIIFLEKIALQHINLKKIN